MPQPYPLPPSSQPQLFAVFSEAPTESAAFINAQTWPLSAPLLAGRLHWVYLDNWVIFPSDKNGLSRANGAFSRFGSNYPETFVAGPGSDTAWALKTRPINPKNKRLCFFGLTTGTPGVVTLGPARVLEHQDPLHDQFFWSAE
jgi:hypothetical protein